MNDIVCTKCKHEFKAELWEKGKCPNCNKEYCWDEYWSEEDQDYIPYAEFD